MQITTPASQRAATSRRLNKQCARLKDVNMLPFVRKQVCFRCLGVILEKKLFNCDVRREAFTTTGVYLRGLRLNRNGFHLNNIPQMRTFY